MSGNNTRFTRGVPRGHLILSTGLGTGFLPGAPGTWGALLALAIWYVLWALLTPVALFVTTLALIVVTTVVGAWTSHVMEGYWGEDPRTVNIDEFVGTWIALLGAPDGSWTWLTGIAGFALFRVIDIIKTPACRALERVPRGWGVMLDDVLAGAYALAILLLGRLLIQGSCSIF